MGWGPKAPDMSGMNAAALQNAELGREQAALAREQYGDARARQARFDPQFEAVINQALESSRTQDARSAQQWQQYTDVFMPAERRLAEAAADFDSPGRRAAAGAEAVAGVDAQFARGREAQQRGLARAGTGMTAGRALTLDSAQRFAQAKASAGADRAARNQVEATGLSLTDNVAKLGRGVASTGLQAAGLAVNAGQAGSSALGNQQGTYNASLAPATNLYSGATGATNSAGNIYGNIANLQQQSNNSAMAGLGGLGSLAGTLLTAPMTGGGSVLGSLIQSSREVKTRMGPVSGKRARLSLENAKVDRWKYKGGHGDEGEHIGRYAGDVEGDPMGGKAIDVISEIGLHHAAISDISRDLKALKRAAGKSGRRSLAGVEDIESREVA